MANAIKYSSSAQTLALKKGNYWIGTGDVGKGPTSSTDYWHGITPPTNGYTIYVNKANNGPSIRVANNDAELIAITNQIAGTNYNTTLQCFNYFQTQSDKMVVQKDYENIVTDGLVLNLDAGFLPSYPQNGSSWDDLSGVSGTRNATLVNGPVYSSDNGGRIYTDGTNDYISLSNTSPSNPPPWALHHANSVGLTLQFWVNYTIVARNLDGGIAYGDFFGNNASGHYQWQWIKHITGSPSKCYMGFQCVGTGGGYNLTLLDTDTTFVANTWQNWTFTYNKTGNAIKAYLNGSYINKASTTFGTVPPTYQNPTFTLSSIAGRANSSTRYPLLGYWGSILIYNRELSSDEVLHNYNAQKGRFGL